MRNLIYKLLTDRLCSCLKGSIVYHFIDIILPPRHKGRSANRAYWQKQITNYFNQITSSIHIWNLAGLKRTINESGGIFTWRHSNRRQRMAFFSAIWSQNPFDIAQGSAGFASVSVPFDIIYSRSSAEYNKWQRFHKTMFI